MRINLRRFIRPSLVATLALYITPALGEAVSVQSPDKTNTVEVFGIGDGQEGLGIRITRNGRIVLEFTGFTVSLAGNGELSGSAKLGDVQRDTINETFTLPWGKSAEVVNHCERATLRLTDGKGIQWEIDLAAYDDSVAYRYRLPKQEQLSEFTLTKESADVRFVGVPTIHYTALSKFTTDHEAEFHRDELTGVMGPLIDLPLLAVWPDGLALAITEARVRDFPNLYLEPSTDLDSELFHTRLSPLPGNDAACVIGQTPHASPWRVVQLGDSAGELLESNVLLCLNDPPRAILAGLSRARRRGIGGTARSNTRPGPIPG